MQPVSAIGASRVRTGYKALHPVFLSPKSIPEVAMKIDSVKSFLVDNPPPRFGGPRWLFVKIGTDEGLSGVGEATYHTRMDHTALPLIDDLAEEYLIGQDPFQIEKIWNAIYEQRFVRRVGPITSPILSAIDIALWDIAGKAAGQPVYNLLGGRMNDRLRSYSYLSGWRAGQSGEKAAEMALAYMEKGFTAVKFDPVDPRTTDRLEGLRDAALVVRKVREAVGDRCDILIGTHGQFHTHSAIRFAKRVEEFDPLWFEEPVPPENISEMARVARATSIPVATGERLFNKFEFVTMLEQKAASILQFDLTISGGILEARKIAAMAEANYVQIAPHLYGGPVGAAASMHIDASLCPELLIQEGIDDWGGFLPMSFRNLCSGRMAITFRLPSQAWESNSTRPSWTSMRRPYRVAGQVAPASITTLGFSQHQTWDDSPTVHGAGGCRSTRCTKNEENRFEHPGDRCP